MSGHWTLPFMPVGLDILTMVVASDISRCPNTPWPTCRGYLHKRTHSGFVKGWRKRWFVLKHDGFLLYYKHRKVKCEEGKQLIRVRMKDTGKENLLGLSCVQELLFKTLYCKTLETVVSHLTVQELFFQKSEKYNLCSLLLHKSRDFLSSCLLRFWSYMKNKTNLLVASVNKCRWLKHSSSGHNVDSLPWLAELCAFAALEAESWAGHLEYLFCFPDSMRTVMS